MSVKVKTSWWGQTLENVGKWIKSPLALLWRETVMIGACVRLTSKFENISPMFSSLICQIQKGIHWRNQPWFKQKQNEAGKDAIKGVTLFQYQCTK